MRSIIHQHQRQLPVAEARFGGTCWTRRSGLYTRYVIGLPPTGNLVLDSEIISYSTITVSNVVSGIGRCLAGSCDPLNPPAHSTFTLVAGVMEPNYVGVGYTQGNSDVALMKLTLYDENQFNIRWFSMDLGLVVPGGLTGSYQDFSSLKIYNGSTFQPQGGVINELLGSGAMQVSGNAHIVLNDQNAGSPGYVLISTTPTTFWVAADINSSAKANDVFALKAWTNAAVTIGALTAGDGRHTVDPVNFPFQSGPNVISATVDTMTVAFTDVLPGVCAAGGH